MAALPGRTGDDHISAEQAALRRVATLVARAASPEDVFTAVAEEARRLLGADHTAMARYDPDGTRTVVAASSSSGATFRVGDRIRLGGRNVPTLVFETGRAARIDDYVEGSGPIAEAARELGLGAAVGVPVSVEGRLWGIVIVGSRLAPLPAGTEERLAGFTELAATAIANAQARVELRGFAEEQAALRRVATLVARAAPSAEVLTAITEEAGRLLHADLATMNRYGADGSISVVATWSSTGAAFSAGGVGKLGGRNLQTMVFQTQRPARIDDYASASGKIAEAAREFGVRAAVGVPVSVEGQLWGVMVAGSRAEALPADTEEQLAGFTELAATAIANAEAQAALTASRARIVAAADATRQRIERDLHDGAQQRLVSLALELRAAEAAAPADAAGLVEQLDGVAAGLDGVLAELREIARGLHPAILADGGLRPALKTLARRSAVPVHLDIQVVGRLPEPVEIAAYFTVSEALTNVAKHARATAADVEVAVRGGVLRVGVRDDGRGGAGFSHGSGLVGLKDRAEALGGHLRLHSPPGAGTVLEIDLPLNDTGGDALPAPVMHDLIERAAVGMDDRAQRTIGRVANSYQVGHQMVVGHAQDRAGLVLVSYRGMASADAQVGGSEQHRVGRLAEIVLIDEPRTLVGRRGSNQRDGGRGVGYVACSLPDASQLSELLPVGYDDEVPVLPVGCGRSTPPGLGDPRKMLLGHWLGCVTADIATDADRIPGLHLAFSCR